MPGKVGFIPAVLFGIMAFIAFAAWLWRKLRRSKPVERDAEDCEHLDRDTEDSDRLKHEAEYSRRLKRIAEILIGRARTQSAFLPGGDQPGAKQAEALIEQDIRAGISTLARVGKIEAAEAAERGDTKAADDAIAATITKIDPEWLGATKEEAALYRQRGGLAYTDDTQAALRFYAEAAELDPEHIEGLFSLAQLQIRAGYRPASTQNLKRLIALENRIEDEQQRHCAHSLGEDVEATLGDRNAASGRFERAQTLVDDLIQRDPHNAEEQRDLSESYDRVGDISAARADRDGALNAYTDGLEIAKKLAARDPNNAEWQRDLSVSYNLIGDISAARGDHEGALKAYSDGLEIARTLADRDPNNAEWQCDLSVSYDRVGDISAALGDYDGALKAYSAGLEIDKQLAAREPNNAEWQRDLSVSYIRIGDISAARGDRDAALKAFNNGLYIAKLLAARDPNNAERQRDLSISYERVGDISADGGDRDGALKAFNDGLDIRKLLAARDPNNVGWQTDLVVSAWKLADAGAKDKRQHLASGLAILKRLGAEGKLTADQKEWIWDFEEAMHKPEKAEPHR